MAGAHAGTPDPIHTRPAPHGRRRAESPPSEPDNIPTEGIPVVRTRSRHRAPTAPLGGKKVGAFAVGSVTGTIMMIQMGLTPTGQTPTTVPRAEAHDQGDRLGIITADVKAVLEQAETRVETIPAPKPIVLEPAVGPITPLQPAPVPAAPPPAPAPVVRAPAPVAPPPAPAPVVPPQPVAPPSSGKAATIAAAAIAQLGVDQDCTMLVTNALARAGVRFHDWPAGYLSLGPQVSPANAIPGDLLYYAQNGSAVPHIAVYIGNGRAIHGGWNGFDTIEWSVNVGWPAYPPTAYIRVA